MQIEKEGVGHVGTCRNIEVKKVEEEKKVSMEVEGEEL